ncbi:MAG: SAM-dependent methyltransferase [Candidatus Pelagibacter bacterium]|nr:SAM-dependent methyltransferase [Candidatus Pelagibacter bacterium]MBL6861269.1 SAM-dependent methyltransferase [Candidatus Pelagibacter bacterium]
MKSNIKFFKKSKSLPVDEFFKNVLYDNKSGYYVSKLPFGEKGDFITSPTISYLFSEIIAIWMVSTWELFGKPKSFNIVELGPGNGSLTNVLLRSFKKFPEFNSVKNIFLYEESNYLKKIQKKNILDKNINWINNFNLIKKGPVIFFGNEFFDALPIKQFKRKKNSILEKNFILDKSYKIKEIFNKASKNDIKTLKSYKTLKKLNFIEFPKFGFQELKKMIKKISELKGCILLVDYGYLKSNNQNTLQSVMKHKKNNLLDNLGKADITAHVNFDLLNEFFLKNNLKVNNIISQKEFLENMGIIERAKIVAKKMKFSQQSDLYLRIKRLLSPRAMGNLFKVILAYKFKNNNFAGFK